MEIELRPVLLVSEHSRDKPALPWPQFQTAGQPFAPQSSPRVASSLTRAGLSFGKATPFGRSDAPMTKYFELADQRGFSRHHGNATNHAVSKSSSDITTYAAQFAVEKDELKTMPFCKGVGVSKLARHTPLLSLRVCSVLLFRANQLLDRANERDGGF
jgi:hypothetical protein